jgi:hypothetical protein
VSRDLALSYLARGWAPIPACAPIDKTHCHHHGLCASAGKRPLLTSWKPYQERLPTEAEVTQWWTDNPTANVAIITGAISGLAVIDLDSEEAVESAQARGYPDSCGMVTTGNGRHLYFASRPGMPTVFAKRSGIDFRGDGGYVHGAGLPALVGGTTTNGLRAAARIPPTPPLLD